MYFACAFPIIRRGMRICSTIVRYTSAIRITFSSSLLAYTLLELTVYIPS